MILTEVVDLLTERLTLTEDRYQRGIVSSIELYQIQQDLNATRSGLPLLRSQIVSARGRLAVLLGRYPHEVDPMLTGVGIPTINLKKSLRESQQEYYRGDPTSRQPHLGSKQPDREWGNGKQPGSRQSI